MKFTNESFNAFADRLKKKVQLSISIVDTDLTINIASTEVDRHNLDVGGDKFRAQVRGDFRFLDYKSSFYVELFVPHHFFNVDYCRDEVKRAVGRAIAEQYIANDSRHVYHDVFLNPADVFNELLKMKDRYIELFKLLGISKSFLPGFKGLTPTIFPMINSAAGKVHLFSTIKDVRDILRFFEIPIEYEDTELIFLRYKTDVVEMQVTFVRLTRKDVAIGDHTHCKQASERMTLKERLKM